MIEINKTATQPRAEFRVHVDNCHASLYLEDLVSGHDLGELSSSGKDEIEVCSNLARFCLTLGYGGLLSFENEHGEEFCQADLSNSKVTLRFRGPARVA